MICREYIPVYTKRLHSSHKHSNRIGGLNPNIRDVFRNSFSGEAKFEDEEKGNQVFPTYVVATSK